MLTVARTAAVLLAAAALMLTSCTRVIDDATPVAGPDRSLPSAPPKTSGAPAAEAGPCTQVDAPLTTIPTKTGEPVLKIPQPPGWTRSTMLDSELIRFAMANSSLTKDGFAPPAVVVLQGGPGAEDPRVVFDAQRHALETELGVTELQIADQTLCGLPAQGVRYQTPVIGNVRPHPAKGLFAVMHTDDMTYAVALTLQTTDPDNPTYEHDSELILSGFQFLPPLTG